MNMTLIGCKVFTRELYHLCAHSPHNVEIRWMKAALHNFPGTLRPALQAEIDRIEDEEESTCEAILLGYGLCSMGVVGLRTKKLPLVVPRAHDCITLLLGAQKTYRDLFEAHNGGVYWYSSGWIEQFKIPGKQYDEQAKYTEYVMKYGEENAEYLIEMEKGWTQHYDLAALIEWPGLENEKWDEMTRKIAADQNLDYERIEGKDTMLRKMVYGEWDKDFVVVQPGQELAYASDDTIMIAKDRDW